MLTGVELCDTIVIYSYKGWSYSLVKSPNGMPLFQPIVIQDGCMVFDCERLVLFELFMN